MCVIIKYSLVPSSLGHIKRSLDTGPSLNPIPLNRLFDIFFSVSAFMEITSIYPIYEIGGLNHCNFYYLIFITYHFYFVPLN